MTLLNLSNRKIITGGNDLSDVTKELVNNKLSEGIFFGVTRVIREPYLRNIALFTFFSTCIATVLYFHQAQLVSAYSDDPIKRTALFANIDLVVNIITVIFQIIIVGRVAKKSGVIYLLVLVPLLVAIGLVCISYMPFIETILIIQIINRAGSHGLVKPGREMLYSILCREDKYKTKTVIDTVVYRGGDALSGWLYGGLKMCSLSIIGISIATLPVALLCIMMGLYLSDKYSKHTKNN
jgi:AAA family ATP:ADP antiporter